MTGIGRGAQDAVVVAGYRTGWRLVRRLPERAAYGLFDRIADRMARRGGHSIQRLRDNYAVVRPELSASELDELVRAGARSYLRYWCEAFRLPDLGPDDLLRSVRVLGDAPVRASLAEGRSVICFLGHLGNWDVAGAWGTRHLGPVVTVAERLQPEEVFEEFLAFRERLGMRIIPLTGAGDVFDLLTEAARGAAVIPLLADRDLTRGGIEVDFAGDRSRVAIGPAALAYDSDSDLHPVSIHYERAADGPGGWRSVITFHERVERPEGESRHRAIRSMTADCAATLGQAVRSHTEDWHMMQRVFVRHLDRQRVAR
ncbi:MAG: phosphatidylinositol mannoside acyltransferase [Dermatophilaceae bacterium]|nr:phosphatidylinositol mannoside acyltransferase [Intrasporangiaceae bacterium]